MKGDCQLQFAINTNLSQMGRNSPLNKGASMIVFGDEITVPQHFIV
jgi:hypothetical protein